MKYVVIVDQSQEGSLEGFSAIGPFNSEFEAESVVDRIDQLAKDALFTINFVAFTELSEPSPEGPFIKELIERGPTSLLTSTPTSSQPRWWCQAVPLSMIYQGT